MKITIAILLSLMLISCIKEFEQKENTMIKPSIFNAINFTDDFNRESKFFDPQRQRMEGLICPSSACLSFEFTPDTMPDSTPGATLFAKLSNGNIAELTETHVTELTDRYIYFFLIAYIGLVPGECEFYMQVDGYDEIVYSEKCISYSVDSLASEGIVLILAYNNDATNGFCTSEYPGGGLFEVSEFNCNDVHIDKTEYGYSFGRTEILHSEIYIKKRLRFMNPSMYQRNLLKILCNLQNKTINGIEYCLSGDFVDVQRDDGSEIWDLQADFVLRADPTFYATGATTAPSAIKPTNLFMR